MQPDRSSDVTRILLFILVIGSLLLGSLWTLLPFLSGLIWATTIAVATWPLLQRVERATGGRRSLAVALMTVVVLLVFIVPFALAVSAVLDAARTVEEPDRAVIGRRVTLREDDGGSVTYAIVFPGDGDPAQGWISADSPLGSAVLGQGVGDRVEVEAPAGRRSVTVLAID